MSDKKNQGNFENPYNKVFYNTALNRTRRMLLKTNNPENNDNVRPKAPLIHDIKKQTQTVKIIKVNPVAKKSSENKNNKSKIKQPSTKTKATSSKNKNPNNKNDNNDKLEANKESDGKNQNGNKGDEIIDVEDDEENKEVTYITGSKTLYKRIRRIEKFIKDLNKVPTELIVPNESKDQPQQIQNPTKESTLMTWNKKVEPPACQCNCYHSGSGQNNTYYSSRRFNRHNYHGNQSTPYNINSRNRYQLNDQRRYNNNYRPYNNYNNYQPNYKYNRRLNYNYNHNPANQNSYSRSYN